jgi:CO dehydrogenase/acetyl-CoA synthase beta subunit
LTLLVIKDMRRVPKRLRTGDKPVVEAIKVKVESDDKDDKEEEEEEESSDDEEEEDEGQEEQVVQPVAQRLRAESCGIRCTHRTHPL